MLRRPGRSDGIPRLGWVALACVCLWAAAALVYPPITKYELYEPGLGGREGDVGQYVRMYQGVPLAQVVSPFRYRLFTPFMARLVPEVPHGLLRYFDVNADKLVKYHFGIVNLFGLAVAGLLLVALCASLGFATREGLLAALLFYTSFPVVNYAGAPMVDAWAYAFLLLGLLAAVRGSIPWLLVAFLIGMLAKETTLLLVLAVLLLDDPLGAKFRKLAALLPGLVAYAVLRFILYPGGYVFPSEPGGALENVIWRLRHGPYLAWVLFEGATAFGFLCPLAALGAWSLRGSPRHPLMRLAWLVPVVLLVPLVNAIGYGSGIGRIWFYTFPVMIPLTLVGLRRLLGEGRVQTLGPGVA